MGWWVQAHRHICQVIVEAQIEAVAGSDSISVASDWELFLLLALIIRQQPVPRSPATLLQAVLKFYNALEYPLIHWNTLEYTEVYCVRITASGSPVMPLAACPSWIF